MIDFVAETVVSLADATAMLPARRAGKRPHVATLYRWASRGLRGVKLETLQVGGTKCTSIEALQCFFEQLRESTVFCDPAKAPRKEREIERIDNERNRTVC